MAKACPQCHNSFSPQHSCPRCEPPKAGLNLVNESSEGNTSSGVSWHDGLSNRLFLCPFMILGLCYGLLLLASSLAGLFPKGSAHGGFDHRFGFALFAGLQGFAVLCLSPLVGLGQKQGYLYGGVVGLGTGLVVGLTTAAGLTSELAEPFLQTTDLAGRNMVLWGLPLLHCFCGVIGGILGGRIWRPLPKLPAPRHVSPGQQLDSRLARSVNRRARGWLPWSGPMHWGRIVVGILVAICGVVWAAEVARCVIDAGDGYLKVANASQSRAMIGEIFALTMLLGGCIAGAGTPNGLKQGIVVGMVSGTVTASLMASGLAVSAGVLPVPFAWAVFLGAMGGWFGTELLPAAAPGLPRLARR